MSSLRTVVLFALCLLGTLHYGASVPEFLGPDSRVAYIDENSPADTFVLQVYANDPADPSSTFTFHLTSTQFTISSTGIVRVVASPSPALDRETTSSISITITLMSGGATVDSLPVVIHLNDLNDNSPVWENPIASIATPFSESTPLGHLIYTIVASDADLGSNGDIRFRITVPSNGMFVVDSHSGVITLARPLDFDTSRNHNITVVAEDQGNPLMSTMMSFSISVSAIVAAPPTFSRSHYFATINEGDYSVTNMNNIVSVVAVATNVPSSAAVVYSQVTRGVASDSLFTVSANGAINAVGMFDRETATSYDIQVQAIVTIPGMPSSAADLALVTIDILDINDNPPVFQNVHPDPIVLHENTPVSTVIYTFYATDADEGSNGLITYELVSPASGPFSVGSISGVIHLTGSLNYNTNPSYTITVRAQDAGTPQLTATSTLTITVGNIITAPPTFTENIYNFEVLEGDYTDHQIGRVQALDAADPNSQLIRYEQISRGDATDTLFSVTSIGASAGQIAVTGTLDRESVHTYSISIRAFGVLSMSSMVPQTEISVVSVVIVVGDVNDNTPRWTSTFPAITLPESQPIGTDIFTASATDADSGSNGRISYSIVSPPANFPFSINEITGVIQLTGVLDFDTQSSYTFTVSAQDGGSPANSITRPLSVTVQDSTDPAPTFTQSIYTFSIAEGTYTSELIGTVMAVDSLHPSATIRYEKVSTDSLFTVASSGSDAGSISLSGTVDADTDPRTYTIVVRAFRVTIGTTARSDISTVSVIVLITDVNDNPPIWTDATPGPVSITESRPIGTLVHSVTATDDDSGTNGQITYSLPAPVDGPFSIEASTGRILLTSPLDYATRQRYSLNIQAQDGGGRSISAVLVVNVADVVDPAPTFSESVYTEEIQEGMYSNAALATVMAVEPNNPSAIIRYEKVDTGDTLFSVSTTGQVTVSGTLDRETQDTYSISIRAFRVATASSTVALSGTSIVSMLITVNDVNDNDPIFTNPHAMPISVLENRAHGSNLYTFLATDRDNGVNGTVTYSISSPATSPFSIDSGTGALRLTGILDFDIATSYTLTIRAQDGATPPRFRETQFTINIVDILDPPPTFTQSSYSAEVDEGTYTNHLLETVQAVDSLHPTTAVIRYEIIPKGDTSDTLFSIVSSGANSGQISLTGDVTVAVDSYTLNIRAFRVPSAGTTTMRSQVSTVTMTITITDVNNNSPVILNPIATPLNVIETRPAGTVLYTYHASDSDTGPSGTITFSLTPSGIPFNIEPTTGIVRLTGGLDFDAVQSYNMTIIARDGGTPALMDITTLRVVVVDVVDPPPSFSLSQYMFTVNEGVANAVIGRVVATDRESPGSVILRYEQVTKGDVTDTMFDVEEVGNNAGEVTITAAADRERIDSYIISIRVFRVASMTSTTPISGVGVVSVVINIADVNDNAPQILNPLTSALSISESRMAGSVIYTVYATDADSGTNAQLTYSILTSSPVPFSIGSQSGIIRLTNTLNHDTATAYTFTVLAQDGGASPMNATTQVMVTVVDTLDPPPTFSESIYLVELDEGSYSMSSIVTVSAMDTLNSDAVIRYEMVSATGPDGLFSVTNSGAMAGQVQLTGTLDRESAMTTYSLNIRAFRVSSATATTPRSIASSVSVIVSVLDLNDNAPVWLNPSSAAISVPETSSVGSAIYTVIVSDADEGSNGRVRLTLTAPADGSFSVSQDGVVSVDGQLDAETTPTYTISITATDGGTPAMTSTITLMVQVTPAADPPPTFTRLVYTLSTPEANHTSSALHVADVTATPGTVGCTIRYELLSRNDNSHSSFTVGQTSGSVDFNGVLDRETQRTWTVTISATEIDAATSVPKNTLPAYTSVIVTVTDVNDNPPAFITDHLYGSVPESARVGDIAAAGARAFDPDETTNAQFQYFLGPSVSVPFAIDPVTGVVSVSGPLNYETTQDYEFTIVARETRTTQRFSSTATVNIMVVNENDNLPTFAQMAYTFQVAENEAPRLLGTVSATDIDAGNFGSLTYALVGFGTSDRFGIDTATGAISTTAALDYEERTVYHLSVIASDGGGTLTDPNRATTQVVVQVSDVNDHTPACFPAMATVILVENQAYTNFLSMTGSDGDPPNTANSRLTYSITYADSTSAAPTFTISGTGGQISSAALDHETASTYSLRVTVSDAGNPSFTSSPCMVTVNTRDVNDMSPIFTRPTYSTSITETHAVGSPIGITVSASDPEGHMVRYSTEPSEIGSQFFSVDPTTGVITLTQSLDYDAPTDHRSFPFRITATDEFESPRFVSVYVVVTITPVNDNGPIISNPPAQDPFVYNVVEDDGTPLPFPLVTVAASDADGDTLLYSFTATNNHFEIDSSTGAITLVNSLDREQQSQHNFTAQACDPGSRCDSVTLTVNVLDYNDHRPMFQAASLSNSFSYRECEIQDEMVVITLVAEDLIDLGSNNEVEYTIVGGDVSRFTVGSQNGVVRLNGAPESWDFETQPNSYMVTVRGTDSPGGTPRLTTPTDASVMVTVTDCNDFPPVFSSSNSQYEIVLSERTTGPSANEVIFTGISVTDGDGTAANSVSTFSIVGAPGTTNNWFGINPMTADIFILSGAVIDRENSFLQIDASGRGVMSFTVQAQNGQFAVFATVTVIITDINDNNPVIQQTDPVALSLIEHSAIGDVVTIISAVDIYDYAANALITYHITSGNNANKFSINTNTGVVSIAGDLDHEQVTSYTLTVEAREAMGVPASTPDTITIAVTIVGANDNTPMFGREVYTANLVEYNALTSTTPLSPGDTVVTVSATDLDDSTTMAGMMEFRIVSGAMQFGVEMFQIDLTSGVVSILRPDLLDYERQQRFELLIEVYDLAMPLNERRSSTTRLVVDIMDVNDVTPIFLESSYTGFVTEEVPIGSTVVVTPTIGARDEDDNGADMLTFTITSSGPFNISTDGRIVRTTARIDRESLVAQNYTYIITLQVSDEANNIDTATLTITVSDINDNVPRFVSTITTFAVSEDRPIAPDPDALVGQVQAADYDVPNNPPITYYISGGGGGKFIINSTTGEIFLVESLNREEATFYLLNITATDGERLITVELTIIINDANDNDPVFSDSSYRGSIQEELPAGTTVDASFEVTGMDLRVNATDIDVNPVITYMVVDTGVPLPFTVHAETGYITTTEIIDREVADQYRFTIMATDGERLSLPAVIEIVVHDINDNNPVLLTDFFNVTIPERTPAGFVFLFLQATDVDVGTNADISYTIATSDPQNSPNMFRISPQGGGIAAIQEVRLNSQDPTVVTLIINASNPQSSLPPNVQERLDVATVIINIVPINEFAPQFDSVHYSFSINENEDSAMVGRVFANESSSDFGTNITYSIVQSSQDVIFVIDSTNGEITTTRPLDREELDFYQFVVSALDNAVPPRVGFATVDVTILDLNDNPPIFDFPSYPTTLFENIARLSSIDTLLATDTDAGSNAQITYAIVSGNTSVFSINPMTGEVTTQLNLDRESVDRYDLNISATDGGSQPFTTYVSMPITVGDINDNNPIFRSGINQTYELYENTPPPVNITRVFADDKDSGGNAHIVYSFEDFSRTRGPFSINRDTGDVTLTGNLDRETQDEYSVVVVASDQGGGQGIDVRRVPGFFTVVVLDRNDNLPVFDDSSYEFRLREDSPVGTQIGTVSGSDRDIGTNALLFYHIANNNCSNTTCSEFMCIDVNTGVITLRKMIDRESRVVYFDTIAISNQMTITCDVSRSYFPDSTSVPVTLVAEDANDEPPVFVNSTLFAAVAEEAPFGSSVTRLQANDPDTGNGSIIWFATNSPEEPFSVDRESGDVTTTGTLRKQSGSSLEFEVRAFDNHGVTPSLSTNATLTVLVFKCQEQVQLTFGLDREKIEAKVSTLVELLNRIVKTRIIITNVNVKRSSSGTVDITGTDLTFFSLDTATRSVINPTAIIRLIDENYEIVRSFFEECRVEQIAIAPCNDIVPTPVDSPFPFWLWIILALLLLGLCCLCCCCVLVCVGERRKTRKYKKKVLNQTDIDLSMDQFTKQGFENPVWVDPYPFEYDDTETSVTAGSITNRDNPLYESQELTIEMFQEPVEDEEESVVVEPNVYESQEILLEMFTDDMSEPYSSKEVLLPAPRRDHASPINNYRDDLDRALDGDDDPESATSFI